MRYALALAASLSASAGAEPVRETSTGQSFDSMRPVDGRPYALLGAGVRKKLVVKVYAMALYVDAEEARRAFPALAVRAGGRDHGRLTAGDHAQQFVVWGSFGKLAVLHFVRTVDAEKIRDAFKEGLEEELSDKAPPELRAGAQAFLALFDRPLKEGEEILLRSSGDGRIEVEIAGQKKVGPVSPKLARAVWSIWLGARPISTDLRRALVDRIDQLAGP
jgi:hypothetical protein